MKREFPGMELDLGRICDEETFSFHEQFPIPTQEGGEAECDATITGVIRRTGGRILLNARVACRIGVECSRCLCSFDLHGDTSFNLVFHRGRDATPPDVEEESDFIFLTDTIEKRYDIFPRVREAVILEMPIKILCKEDCKGLCSKCGANLNEGECGCDLDEGDPRWDALRRLQGSNDD